MVKGNAQKMFAGIGAGMAAIALALSPTRWSMLADVALIAAVLAEIVAAKGLPRKESMPPWAMILFAAWCAIAAAMASSHDGDVPAAMHAFWQIARAFILGAWVFSSQLARGKCAVPLAGLLLGGAASLCTAVVQYRGEGTGASVRGLCFSQDEYCALLCICLPFAMSLLVFSKKVPLRIFGGIVLAAGAFTVLDGGAAVALGSVLAGIAALSVFPRELSSRDDRDLDRKPPKLRGNPVAFFALCALAIVLWQSAVLPHLKRSNDQAHFYSLSIFDMEGRPVLRNAQWQMLGNMGYSESVFGAGLGNWRRFAGQFYDAVPHSDDDPAPEPDHANQYLVLLAESGLAGVLLFGACLLLPFVPARPMWSGEKAAGGEVAEAGCKGGAIAFALAAFWHPSLFGGLALPLAFLIVWGWRLRPQGGLHE